MLVFRSLFILLLDFRISHKCIKSYICITLNFMICMQVKYNTVKYNSIECKI